MQTSSCPLCLSGDAPAIWRNQYLRVIDVPDAGYPGYTRVIWNAHVTEMTDLDATMRQHLMEAVWKVEAALRSTLAPHKVNLAQFGNQVPHLHWHVIPRWPLDPHFPDAVWAAVRPRTPDGQREWQTLCAKQDSLLPAYHEALRHALDASLHI